MYVCIVYVHFNSPIKNLKSFNVKMNNLNAQKFTIKTKIR